MLSSFDQNATPVTNSSGNLAATAGAATLPLVKGSTLALAGFEVTGSGATAASNILVTVTGVISGTLTYILPIPAGVTLSIVPLIVEFTLAVEASASGVAIAVNVPSFGAGNTNAAVVAHGFYVAVE
jgi:hypothetical protein